MGNHITVDPTAAGDKKYSGNNRSQNESVAARF
jgi:hypothetical protein